MEWSDPATTRVTELGKRLVNAFNPVSGGSHEDYPDRAVFQSLAQPDGTRLGQSNRLEYWVEPVVIDQVESSVDTIFPGPIDEEVLPGRPVQRVENSRQAGPIRASPPGRLLASVRANAGTARTAIMTGSTEDDDEVPSKARERARAVKTVANTVAWIA